MKIINIYISKLGNVNENLISKEFLNRVNTYGSSKARIESLSGRSLINEVLVEKGIKNPLFIHNKFGKPYLSDNAFYFNLSHSYDYLALVIADQEIGIDIELIDFKAARVKRRFTTKTTTQNETDFYTKLWVLKEGFMKWLGVGLTIPLKEIMIKEIDSYKDLYSVSYKEEITTCKVVKYEDYYIGVCLNNIEDYSLKIEVR